MKTLFNKITKNIFLPLAIASGFAFNSYAQDSHNHSRLEKDSIAKISRALNLDLNDHFSGDYGDLKVKMIEVKITDIENPEENSASSTDFKYNEQGRKIEEIYKKGSGEKLYIEKVKYKYDEQGRKTEITYELDKENDGKVDFIGKINSEYDKQGREIKAIRKEDKNNDGKFDYVMQHHYKYDDQGKMIRAKILIDLDGDGVFDKIEEK